MNNRYLRTAWLDEPSPPKPHPAARTCPPCPRRFMSSDVGHRICDRCKGDEEEEWGSAALREDFSVGVPDQTLE